MDKLNVEKIASLNGDFFPYVLARFPRFDSYAIGVMDLNDDGARDGGESDVILYFLITPDEFAYYPDKMDELNDLAQVLQIRMPKSRFLMGISSSGKEAEAVQEVVKHSLGDDFLENDTAFDEWLAERRKKNQEAKAKQAQIQKAVSEKLAAIPKTPFNDARMALFNHQAEVNRHDRVIKQQVKTIQNQIKTENPEATPAMIQEVIDKDPMVIQMQEARKAATANGKELEEALGNRIFTADEIYVAIDTCGPKGYPLIDPAKATAFIFSTQEIADRFAATMAQQKRFFVTIQKIERSGIKDALRLWESMGIAILVVDDGEMPTRILIRNIIPALEKGFIERHNSDIRNIMIRLKEIGGLMNLHGSEIDEKWKNSLQKLAQQLEFHLFKSLASTALFVPVQMPSKQLEQMQGNYLYTPEANKKIMDLAKERKMEKAPMARAGFTGKHVVMPYKGVLPILKLTLQQNNKENAPIRHVFAAYTSREDAMKATEKTPNTTILAVGMEELVAQYGEHKKIFDNSELQGEFTGMIIDPQTIMQLLDAPLMQHSLNVLAASKPKEEA